MNMRILALLLAVLPMAATAASTWQSISAELGKRIEIDRASIKKEEGGKVLARGRMILDRELNDPQTSSTYRIIEALTRYDCATRSASTVKRTYLKNDSDVLREEEIRNPISMPVRSGTLDDKVLREVCRPSGAGTPVEAASGKSDPRQLAGKVADASGDLRKANEAMIQKQVAKAAHGDASAKAMRTSVASEKPAESHEHAAAPAVATHEPAPRKPRGESVRKAPVEPAVAHAHIHWSYDGEGGPENWARLEEKNKLCASGQRQSPIDIREGIRVDLEPIVFDYRPSQFRIVDNGHTVQVSVGNGSITLTGKTYELVQFHFHKPSEERVNGRSFDMVAHLVHRADDGRLAVVAVLLEKGTENPMIQTLWNNLPLEKNVDVLPPAASINLEQFLPTSRAYYTYMGSLTTPPCSEGVLWLVLKQPVAISPEQVAIFSRLYRNNARPIQPVNNRLIKESR